MPSPFGQVVAEQLAQIFHDEDESKNLVEDAGLPQNRAPVFRAMTSSQTYWREVVNRIETGSIDAEHLARRGLKNGLASLLLEARKARRGNTTLAALYELANSVVNPALLAIPVELLAPDPAALAPPGRGPEAVHKILVFGATPHDESALRVTREFKAIKAAVEAAGAVVRFHAEPHLSTEPGDVLRVLEAERPTVLHFCGHVDPTGGGDGGALVLETAAGRSALLRHTVLADIVRELKDDGLELDGIVLNACASESARAALDGLVPVLVGTRRAIADDMAVGFADGFYQALAQWKSVARAVRRGKIAADTAGAGGANRAVGAGDGGTGPAPTDPNNYLAWPADGLDKVYIPRR